MKKIIIVLLYLTVNIIGNDNLTILESAKKDLHVKEDKRKHKDNPRVTEYHRSTGNSYDDDIAWCSSFVNYHVKEVGLKGTDSAAAASWREWGHEVKPQVGAIAVKPRYEDGKLVGNHVGIVSSIDPQKGTLQLLGGNQGKRGEVKESTYSIKAFDAFRMPGIDNISNVQVIYEEITQSIKMTKLFAKIPKVNV